MKKLILLLSGIYICITLGGCTFNTTNTKNNEPQLSKDEAIISTGFFIDGELPDIGDFTGKRTERFYSEPTYEFIPSDTYKKIIPFVSNYKVFQSDITDINSPV